MTTYDHRLMKPLRTLLTVAVSAVILSTAAVVAGTGPAAAAPPSNVDCGPALATGYGPLRSCTQVLVVGTNVVGRSGFYSGLADNWNPETAWVGVVDGGPYSRNVIAVDGLNGMFVGHHVLKTGFGRVVFGVQHQATRGRFGTYSLETSRFHPSHGWMPLA